MNIGQALHPLYQAIASLLAYCYALIPNYAVAIAMLTLIVMAVLSPLTLKSTRSMLAMQRLQPEMKKLQTKYKGDRQKLNEEMMKFYKENKINPVGGCLPLILQLPVFFILYSVIRGLTTVGPHGVAEPKYISHNTQLYHDLVASHGQMVSFGVDLSKSATSVHGAFFTALPFYIIIIIAIGLQYLQLRQLSARNPAAAAANPQMQKIQKFMPLFFSVIYIGIPAGVNVYFIISSLARIGQQELMFRFDPKVKEQVPREKSVDRGGGKPIEVKEVKERPSAGKSGDGGQKPGGPRSGGTGQKPAGTGQKPAGTGQRPGGPNQRRRPPAKAGSNGGGGSQDGASSSRRTRNGGRAAEAEPRAIQSKATNGSESADGTGTTDGSGSRDGSGSEDGSGSTETTRAEWTKAPRQKPHQRVQSKRTRKSR